jgi:hypothetical protein
MLSRKVTAAAPARLSTWRVSAPSCRAAPRPRRQPVLVAALHGHKRDEEEVGAAFTTAALRGRRCMAPAAVSLLAVAPDLGGGMQAQAAEPAVGASGLRRGRRPLTRASALLSFFNLCLSRVDLR